MKRDRRGVVLLVVVLAALGGGAAVYLLPERARELAPAVDPQAHAPTLAQEHEHEHEHKAAGPATPAYAGELHERFQQAAVMLHAGQHEYALAALERVLELAPNLPEAHVNAGFALIELGSPERAEQHFRTAIDLRPGQVNAYYGLAMTREAAGDLAMALGAMRTFIHLSPDDSPHLARARAALWEWEARQDAAPPQQANSEPQDGAEQPDGV